MDVVNGVIKIAVPGGGDGASRGIGDLYPEFMALLQEAWDTGLDFETEWYGSKHELESAKLSRSGDMVTAEAACYCDEDNDLITDAMWSLAKDTDFKGDDGWEWVHTFGVPDTDEAHEAFLERVSNHLMQAEVQISDPRFTDTQTAKATTLSALLGIAEVAMAEAQQENEFNFNCVKDTVNYVCNDVKENGWDNE